MGARVQVQIVTDYDYEHDVFLYDHWGAGGCALQAVQTAIGREIRWNDSEYFARAIFCQMLIQHYGTKTLDTGEAMPVSSLLEETSMGIGTSLHGDTEELIICDMARERVAVIDPWSFRDRTNGIPDMDAYESMREKLSAMSDDVSKVPDKYWQPYKSFMMLDESQLQKLLETEA